MVWGLQVSIPSPPMASQLAVNLTPDPGILPACPVRNVPKIERRPLSCCENREVLSATLGNPHVTGLLVTGLTPHPPCRMMCSLDLVRRSYLLAPDELFIHSYLRYHARKKGDEFKFATQQTTFAHCCLDMDSCTCSLARSSHPITLASMHPVVVLRSMQRHSFFARKFSPNQVWRPPTRA